MSLKLKENLIPLYLPIATFFLVIIAQVLWSPIHGDGAVYANMIREVSENGSKFPLHWGDGTGFFDHPYLFFVVAAPIFKFFHGIGFSDDVAVKIPNFIFGFLFLLLIFKIVSKKSNRGTGILACYLALIFPVFEEQVRQPTLDVLMHLLVFTGVAYLVFDFEKNKSAFLTGCFLGLACLVKGVEVFPYIASVGVLILFFSKAKFPLKKVLIFGLAVLTPVLLWLLLDHFFADGVWQTNYIRRQFTERFFAHSNFQSPLSLAFFKGFLSFYALQILVLLVALIRLWLRGFRPSLLFWFCSLYLLFLNLAFAIIKKDSSQHYFGATIVLVLMLTEIFYFWISTSKAAKLQQLSKYLVLVGFVVSASMAGYFVVKPFDQKGTWLNIKEVGAQLKDVPNEVPVVISGIIDDDYGVKNTAYWYWHPKKVFFNRNEIDEAQGGSVLVKNIESVDNLLILKK